MCHDVGMVVAPPPTPPQPGAHPFQGVGIRSFVASADESIEAIAGSSRLTLVVGAGVSQEAGLPSWGDLVFELLKAVAENTDGYRTLRQQSSPESQKAGRNLAEQYARLAIESQGLLGAASLVRAWLTAAQFGETLHRVLYRRRNEEKLPLSPGATAREIARLWQTFDDPSHLTVLTTNYDLLIEQALLDAGIPHERIVSSLVDDRVPDGSYAVIHLHGILEPDGVPAANEVDNVILTEDQYFGGDPRARARRELCVDRLNTDTCLLIGVGMTDPNVLSYLYEAGESGEAQRDQELGEPLEAAERVGIPVSRPSRFTITVSQGDLPIGRETMPMSATA